VYGSRPGLASTDAQAPSRDTTPNRDVEREAGTAASRTMWGFIAAAASGASAVPVLAYLWTIIEWWVTAPVGTVHPQSIVTPFSAFLFFIGVICFLIFWTGVAIPLAFIPFIVVHGAARRLHITSATYYVVCGGSSGALLAVPWLLARSLTPNSGLTALSQQSPRAWGLFFIGGALGGFVFWRIGVRPQSATGES
jgi:hypothetical protein